jgi:hypothetical protein
MGSCRRSTLPWVRRGFSPAATAAFFTTLLVLAVVGWSIGWLAAGTDLAGQQTSTTPTATPSHTSSEPTRPPTTSPSASPSNNAFGMPNLVGKKFKLARQQAFDLKLGVTIHFDEPKNLPAGTVARTFPEDTVLVRPGFQVILYVTGPAPKVTVPLLTGKTCTEGKDALIDVGLRIDSYPSGDKGRVVKTDPLALSELTWNDPVKVYCTQASASP